MCVCARAHVCFMRRVETMQQDDASLLDRSEARLAAALRTAAAAAAAGDSRRAPGGVAPHPSRATTRTFSDSDDSEFFNCSYLSLTPCACAWCERRSTSIRVGRHSRTQAPRRSSALTAPPPQSRSSHRAQNDPSGIHSAHGPPARPFRPALSTSPRPRASSWGRVGRRRTSALSCRSRRPASAACAAL